MIFFVIKKVSLESSFLATNLISQSLVTTQKRLLKRSRSGNQICREVRSISGRVALIVVGEDGGSDPLGDSLPREVLVLHYLNLFIVIVGL